MGKAALAVAALASLMVLGFPALAIADTEPEVKKSRNGICHDRDSTSYERTRKFEPYDSMAACIASGGRSSKATVGGFKRITRRAGDWIQELLDSDLAWLWISIGLAILGMMGFGIWRLRRGPGKRLEELERKRWESHRLEPKDKN